jgi:hypothetical protein
VADSGHLILISDMLPFRIWRLPSTGKRRYLALPVGTASLAPAGSSTCHHLLSQVFGLMSSSLPMRFPLAPCRERYSGTAYSIPQRRSRPKTKTALGCLRRSDGKLGNWWRPVRAFLDHLHAVPDVASWRLQMMGLEPAAVRCCRGRILVGV